MFHQLLLLISEYFWSLNVDRREGFAQTWRHSNRRWAIQLLHHNSYFLLATMTWCNNYCSQCRLFNHRVPWAWDEAHRHYKEDEVRLREAISSRGCRSARGAFVSKGREGVARCLQDNLKDLQSYRRLVSAPAIPEVVSKSMAVAATGGETIVHPPVGGR
jgi:hypothetical protein